jgi:hypothetical protein
MFFLPAEMTITAFASAIKIDSHYQSKIKGRDAA